MNNSQFWSWVDHWEGTDFMQDELEDELEIEDWADEALWMVCLLCGSPLEACDCKAQTPIPPPSSTSTSPPSSVTFFSELEELTRIDGIAHNHGN